MIKVWDWFVGENDKDAGLDDSSLADMMEENTEVLIFPTTQHDSDYLTCLT